MKSSLEEEHGFLPKAEPGMLLVPSVRVCVLGQRLGQRLGHVSRRACGHSPSSYWLRSLGRSLDLGFLICKKGSFHLIE